MTKNRRGHGEGAMYERKDGRWAGSYELGFQDGKRKRKTVYGKTQKEVAQKLQKIRTDVELGRPVVDDRRAVEGFFVTWLEQVVKPSVGPRTYESYEMIGRVHLMPALGSIKLNRLHARDVQALIANMVDAGLSDRTVEYAWQVLRRALKVAVKWGLVRQNVAELVTPPRPRTAEVVPMNVQEIQAVLGAAKGHPLEAAFMLAITTGLRRGELLALKADDLALDGEAAHLRVTGSLQRIGGALTVTEPKSQKSRRTVALSERAVAARRRRKAHQAQERLSAGPQWQDNQFVFTTSIGSPVDPRNFLRQWYKLLDQAGVDRRPLHHARHTAASLMLSEGVPLKVVQETLGHSTIQLTADRYGHLMPHDGQRVADAMNRALGA